MTAKASLDELARRTPRPCSRDGVGWQVANMCERRAVGRRSFGISGFRVFAAVSGFPGEAAPRGGRREIPNAAAAPPHGN